MFPWPRCFAFTVSMVLLLSLPTEFVNATNTGANRGDTEAEDAQVHVPAKVVLAENGMVDALPAMINSFFHERDLDDDTKLCLSGASATLLELLFAVGERLAKEVEDATKRNTEMLRQDSLNIMNSTTQLVRTLQTLTEVCLDDDLQHAFRVIGVHLSNGTYVLEHLEANIDGIFVELVAASEAVNERDFKSFGKHLGRSLRLIMLSDAILPEGPPNGNITGSVIDGLFIGFFGDRAALTITRDGDTDPDHVVHINFRRCLSGNMEYWESIWTDLWLLCASASSSNSSAGEADAGASVGKRWEDVSALLLLQLPEAMARCGLSEERLEMLLDALAAVKTLNFEMAMPGSIDLYSTLENLGKGVDAWEKGHYHTFGKDIGLFLRGILLHFLKDKYIVSKNTGALNARLSRSDGIGAGSAKVSFFVMAVVVAVLGLLAAVSAAAAVLLSVRRCQQRTSRLFQQHQEHEPLE